MYQSAQITRQQENKKCGWFKVNVWVNLIVKKGRRAVTDVDNPILMEKINWVKEISIYARMSINEQKYWYVIGVNVECGVLSSGREINGLLIGKSVQ